MSGPEAPYLSVVIPTFNDQPALERSLPVLKQHLEELCARYEIIVVDDGSDDPESTARITRAHDCRLERNPSNSGKGAAVRRGMLAATGRFRIFTDADVPYELNTFDRALWFLDSQHFDMIAGDRTLPESAYHAEVPLARAIGSKACSFLTGRILTGGWFDTQCGFKGFRGEVADDLFGVGRIDGFAFDIELIYIALHRNYDIKRIPVVLRRHEGSSVRILRDSALILRDLGRIRAHHALGLYQPRSLVTRRWNPPPAWKPDREEPR